MRSGRGRVGHNTSPWITNTTSASAAVPGSYLEYFYLGTVLFQNFRVLQSDPYLRTHTQERERDTC